MNYIKSIITNLALLTLPYAHAETAKPQPKPFAIHESALLNLKPLNLPRQEQSKVKPSLDKLKQAAINTGTPIQLQTPTHKTAHSYKAPISALPAAVNAKINRMPHHQLQEFVSKAGDLYGTNNALAQCEKDVRKHYEQIKQGAPVDRILLVNSLKSLLKDDTTRSCCLANELNEIIALIQELPCQQCCGGITEITQADIDPVNGYVITTSGSYCLTEDIVWTGTNSDPLIYIGTAAAIVINASNVELNLNGHTIDLDNRGLVGVKIAPPEFPYFNTISVENIVVHNGFIKNNLCNYISTTTAILCGEPVLPCTNFYSPNVNPIGIVCCECSHVLIENIAIDSVSDGIDTCAEIFDVTQVHIDGCRVSRAVTGMQHLFVSSPAAYAVTIENCFFDCMLQSAIFAEWTMVNLVVDNCIIVNTINSSIVTIPPTGPVPPFTPNVVIKNSIVDTSQAGSCLQINGYNTYIANCQAYNTPQGSNIDIVGTANCLIENCITSNGLVNINLRGVSNNCRVLNCTTANAYYGIYLESLQTGEIINCTCAQQEFGILIIPDGQCGPSQNVTIVGCTVFDSLQVGIGITMGQDCVIDNCLVRNSGINNIEVNNSENIVIQNCSCFIATATYSSNILISAGNTITVEHCVTSSAQNGISLSGIQNGSIVNCTASNARYGIAGTASDSIAITGCKANLNSSVGIQVQASLNCLVQNNRAYDNGIGISNVGTSGGNQYMGNRACNNGINYAVAPSVIIAAADLSAGVFDNVDCSLLANQPYMASNYDTDELAYIECPFKAIERPVNKPLPMQITQSIDVSETPPFYSPNYAGYGVATDFNNPASNAVDYVAGTWIVPTLKPSNEDTYLGIWVGIDGFFDGYVEQCGIGCNYFFCQQSNYAYFATYPAAGIILYGFPVQAGDSFSASVKYLGNNIFEQKVTNHTRGVFASIQLEAPYIAQRSSGEWIVEDTFIGFFPPLANFGTIPWTDCTTTINGITGPIDDSNWQNQAQIMVTAEPPYTVRAYPSGITDTTTPPISSSFDVTFVRSE